MKQFVKILFNVVETLHEFKYMTNIPEKYV